MEVCRLCLDLLHGNNFLQLDGPYRALINSIAPEVNLEISSNPVVCKPCSSSIDELHKFKNQFIENEQRIKQKCNGEFSEELSLKEILHGVNVGEIVVTEKAKERICRTCLNSIDCESFTVLKPSKPDAYLDSMITMCLPELDLQLSRDPVMCEKCLSFLQKLHHLKTSCLDIEEKIKNYCTNHGTNSSAQINLLSVLDPLTDDKKDLPNYPTIQSEVKTEKDIDVEMNNMENKTNNENNHDPLVVPKVEDMEIKTEDACPSTPENESLDKKSINKLDEIMKEILKNQKKETHYSCSQCAFTMANKRHYVMHMLSMHTTFNEETRLMHFCHLCDYKTMYKDQMKKHIENEHMEKEKLNCPFCPFTSFYSTNLKRHISIHEDMQDLVCSHPQCDFKTSYKYSLQRHEVKIHGNQCSVCHYKNKNRSAIQKHLRTVHGIYELHHCDKCNFKTFYLMTLKRHNAREHKGMMKSNFICVKKKKDELTAEEEEEIKALFKD